jgi:hypothetical protein
MRSPLFLNMEVNTLTVNELLQNALALFAETDASDADYQALAIFHTNMVLAETFEVNNRMRERAGKEELTEIPSVTALTDTIPYEDKLLRFALPFGLAEKLYFDEDNDGRLSMFKQEYANRVNQCDRWVVAF